MGQVYSSSADDAKNDTNEEDLHTNLCEDYSTSTGGEDDSPFLEPDAPLLTDEDCRSPLMNDVSNDDGSSISSVASGESSSGDDSDPGEKYNSDKVINDDSKKHSGDSHVATNRSENGVGTSGLNRNGDIAPATNKATTIPMQLTPSVDQPNSLVHNLSDLLSMGNVEIKTRLGSATFTIESIRSADTIVSSTALMTEEDIYSWYNEGNTTINKSNGSMNKSSPRKSHMEVALFMLQNSPSLKSLRFKMVPAKIKEAPFWNAVFYLLLTDEERALMTANAEIAAADNAAPQAQAGPKVAVDALLVQKNIEITKLKEKLAQLEQSLAQAKSQSQGSDTDAINRHNGKWVQDKESLEFHSLDEEIKKKLREGKQKRLQDVQEQMIFILDSDEIKDSRGKWNCCSQTDYHQACTC
jgi:hypothetical protein